jgi:type IV secretion system protein VirB9
MRSVTAVLLCGLIAYAQAETTPPPGRTDARVRVVNYNPEDVVELHGYIGYSVDIQWAEGETFAGVMSGHMLGFAYDDLGNHLSIKPVRAPFTTNMTVLTNKRAYHFEYSANDLPKGGAQPRTMIYSLRFAYPQDEAKAAAERAQAAMTEARASAPSTLARNTDYWYCGTKSIRPEAAWDDGAQTHLRFPPGTEFPALFAMGEDGSESLVNFNVVGADVVIHRTAGRFVLRRGGLVGCVVNKGFEGSGVRLQNNAIAPGVERAIKGADQ